jgi:AmiR/NasT family two-component response regulator
LEQQLAELDKQIQAEKDKAIDEAKALIMQFDIKPEELATD